MPSSKVKKAEALAAEERERAAAADGAMAGADMGQRLETVGRGVSFSQPGCLVSFVGVERVLLCASFFK